MLMRGPHCPQGADLSLDGSATSTSELTLHKRVQQDSLLDLPPSGARGAGTFGHLGLRDFPFYGPQERFATGSPCGRPSFSELVHPCSSLPDVVCGTRQTPASEGGVVGHPGPPGRLLADTHPSSLQKYLELQVGC